MTKEEREAAIKYFELFSLDCLGETCESCPHETACKAYTHDETMEFGKLAIEALKIDVVRCKECKQFMLAKEGFKWGYCNLKSNDYNHYNLDDFCSYGKR